MGGYAWSREEKRAAREVFSYQPVLRNPAPAIRKPMAREELKYVAARDARIPTHIRWKHVQLINPVCYRTRH